MFITDYCTFVRDSTKVMRTPWKAIFTSIPMWALIIVHCGQNWGYWTLITELPTYMNDILKFNLEEVSNNLLYFNTGTTKVVKNQFNQKKINIISHRIVIYF